MSDKMDERASAEEEQAQAGRPSQAVGDRVSEVIRAAEELAEQIRADAHHEATQIKTTAQQAHAKATQQLGEELSAMKAAAEAEAAEIKRTSELYASDHRRSAEAATAKLLAEAETQARAMREAAEQMAMQIETTALRRREELEERTSLVETGLRRFQSGLREISKELDELLDTPRAKAGTLLEALAVDGDKASDAVKEEPTTS